MAEVSNVTDSHFKVTLLLGCACMYVLMYVCLYICIYVFMCVCNFVILSELSKAHDSHFKVILLVAEVQ